MTKQRSEEFQLTGEFVDKPSPQYLETVRMLADLDTYDRAFGEVASSRIQERLRRMGYTQSRGTPCVHRLLGKRSCRGERDCLPPDSDHVTLWNRDGKPAMLVSQPYGVFHDALKGTLAFAEERGLSVFIDAGFSWYWCGTTVAVILTRKGEFHPSKRRAAE